MYLVCLLGAIALLLLLLLGADIFVEASPELPSSFVYLVSGFSILLVAKTLAVVFRRRAPPSAGTVPTATVAPATIVTLNRVVAATLGGAAGGLAGFYVGGFVSLALGMLFIPGGEVGMRALVVPGIDLGTVGGAALGARLGWKLMLCLSIAGGLLQYNSNCSRQWHWAWKRGRPIGPVVKRWWRFAEDASARRVCILLLVLASLTLVGKYLRTQPPELSHVYVHAERTHQVIVGFGTGFDHVAKQCIDALKIPQDRERVYDLLYGDRGVRLNIVRLPISPHARPLPESQGLHFDWSGDKLTQDMRQALQPVLKRTKPILYAVPLTPPPQWKTNGQTMHGGSLRPEHYRDYAFYLTDFLQYQHQIGMGIDVLSLQNEPTIAATWDSCLWTGEELRDFIKLLAPMIRSRGLDTRLMLSDDSNWRNAWAHLEPTLQDPQACAYLSIMASHSYGKCDDLERQGFAAAADKNGKQVWMSEMSLVTPLQTDDPGMTAALRIARYMHQDLVVGHAAVWVFCFGIYNSKYQGSLGVLSPADGQGALVIPKRLWAMANYSRFVRPGSKLMESQSDVLETSAFLNAAGDGFVIVAVNNTPQPRPAVYHFGGGDYTVAEVRAIATTSSLNLGNVRVPETLPHGFFTVLLPSSVTTFVGKFGARPH